jgi:hypothetical protein
MAKDTKQNAHKYVGLWESKLPEIIERLQKAEKGIPSGPLTVNKEEFDKAGGERENTSYHFILKMDEKDVKGKAMAKDLKNVLNESPEARKILQTGHYKIMNTAVVYHLTVAKV